MHIVIAFLGTVVTLLYLLHRLADMGIDLAGLNPFLWRRRRAWRQMIEGNPIFTIENPQELAALLVVWTAKVDGDVSADEKRAITDELTRTMSLKPRTAAELFGSSAFLLRDVSDVNQNLDRILKGSAKRLTAEQAESVLGMMERVADIASATPLQQEFIAAVRRGLAKAPTEPGPWAVS